MTEKKSLSYFESGLVVGASIGLVSGIASMFYYQKNKSISADKVLQSVKDAFLEEGPIEGSWIVFEKEPLRKFAVHSKIYRGGISRIEDTQIIYYEFIADAKTGTVLDIIRKTDGEKA
ncbi:MAG: PepSY domain-containing protein [Enterococcus sp.]